MRSNYPKATLKAAILVVTVLLSMARVSSAQTVNLTASQQTTVLPDGNVVPMWGWTCGAAVTGSTATCTALTYNAATGLHNLQTGGTTWQAPLIVVPYLPGATNLTINLTNTLPVETSLVIIGQAGGGLGAPVREAGPRTDGAHGGQTSTTWIQVLPGSFTPPTQGERARTFTSVEVAGVATFGGAVATPGVYTWTNLNPGTYLIRTGTYPSIQGPMGLYGVLVVTKAPVTGTPGLAYPVPLPTSTTGVTYDADVVALESEIDARQNRMVAALFPATGVAGTSTANAGFSETMKWTSKCGAAVNSLLTPTAAVPTCYPPAVDYTPTYFLINGLAFSKDTRQASALSIPAAASTGNVLVRYVNAGSHMHVPTVDGLNMLLVAEDGYVLPDVALAITNGKVLTANNPPPTTCTTCAVGLRIQDEVFQAAGKVFDVIVSPPSASGSFASATYPTWDRSLALGTNSQRDGGMQAILDVNDTGAAKVAAANSSVTVVADHYGYAPGVTLKVSDPGRGVIANDTNVYGVQLSTVSPAVTLYPNGTFTYVPTGSSADSFGYCANGTTTTSTPAYCTTVTLNVSATANANPGNAPIANNDSYTSATASLMRVAAPGVLRNDTDPHSYPLTAVNVVPSGVTVNLAADGSFTAVPASPGTCGPPTGCSFTYQAKNSQGVLSAAPGAIATLIFQPGSGLHVRVQDAATKAEITDYKWIIEQDLTFQINPACQVNTGAAARPAGCPALPPGSVVPPTPATQFHTSYYPVIATGCTGPQSCGQGQTVYDAGTPCVSGLPVGCSPTAGQHVKAACDGYGICTIGATQLPASLPSDAQLTATNPDSSPARYYISILSGDSTNAFNTANAKDPSVAGNCVPGTEPTGIAVGSTCGHTIGGSPIPAPVAGVFAPVTVNLELEPLKTATVTAFIFEDDFPLNGEPDAGGGIDILASNEPGLGDFQFEIWDTAGGIGDFTGQMTYDTFNVPLTNALNGTIDPSTRLDACPISKTAAGVGVGVIVVCPEFESDGQTHSPLTGQAVVRNLMQGKYSLIAHPGAAREAAGEEWLQTNSLDGGHFLDSFLRVGEPAYFQEFGPGGFHVFMGMANPKIINARLAAICTPSATGQCNNTVKGQVTNLHQGRSPNENLSSAGVFGQGDPHNYAPLSYTNCYASIGDSDGATIGLAKCDPDGNFTFTGLPDGNYGIVIFDQWDDFIVDGSSRPVNISGGTTQNLTFPTFTWQTHLWSRAYMDVGGLGRPVLLPDGNLDPILSPGLIQVPTRVRQRNGKVVNTLLSDITGYSRFDETFPLFAFYTVESDTTRFRGTGVHAVNDEGGKVDGPTPVGNGNTGPYQGILNSKPAFATSELPTDLRYPGTHYCSVADCTDVIAPFTAGGPGGSTGRIDPGNVTVEGWQGGVSQFDMLDWGKTPYIAGENGGIVGHVVYSSTRPFDDPRMNFQNLWDPLVPNVTINLYQEGTAPDGSTSLTLVDTTLTSSWDAWAQGFRTDGVTPNMSCTGQDDFTTDPFFSYTLAGTRNYLFPNTSLPHNSQYKCYDGYHNLNQLQPAPYDGRYQFPSPTCLTVGATFTLVNNPTAYHCATVANPAAGQTGAAPAILPPAKYVTEVIVPPNWELNKEEDLNLLIGDMYIAPAVAQFGGAGLGNIFITPDQASIDAANPSYTGGYSATNPYTPPFSTCATPGVASSCTFTPSTTNNGKQAGDYGRTTFGSFGPGGIVQQNAPCVGLLRIVPDYLSISPESGEVAPFAGVSKNLCDRKEVTLEDTMQANADFFIWTKVAKAVTFTGFISDDFSSEFDPASPAFGEKFAIPNVPVSIKDFNGIEVSRLYSDQWGSYNGLTYGSWEVNVPNITGYSPNMMITCMNDAGPIHSNPLDLTSPLITDPYYNPAYSTFCYENPFMPGDATYLDTPVVPTSAFAEGYNPPDCNYPDGTPAIKSVIGSDGIAGPWVSAPGSTLTVTALGPQTVPNDAYSGPAANTAPYNLKFITRNYNFGTARGTVTIGGVPAVTTWGNTTLTVTVPTIPASASTCKIQQRNMGAGVGPARCGELVITTAPSPAFPNGQQSIDTITVTYGGKRPTVLAPQATIQSAIDAAAPGDEIIIPAGTYYEILLMWKPVRLQGVGAGSVTINASPHPAGKLDPWRHHVNCLFGLAINGQPYSTPGNLVPTPGGVGGVGPDGNPAGHGFQPLNAYDSTGTETCPGTGWNYFTGGPNNPQVDRLPLEGIVGWDTTVNGNLAELLQEPSLMGAYEGAGITVLGKGVRFPAGLDIFGSGLDTAAGSSIAHESQMPVPTIELTNSAADCNDYPSNFQCNPSRIDGITVTNSSQGGGGIFVHAWGHNLEIANNRIYNNGGSVAGGILVGQGESPDALLSGNGGDPLGFNGGTLAGFDQQPWTCLPGAVVPANNPYGYDQVVSPPDTFPGQQLPYCFNLNVNVHHNSISTNAAYGDELFSSTPAGGGGVTVCTGSDYYDFNFNWVCGNLSTGDGGGLAHIGFSWNGDISHNSFLFNQSFNPTLTTHGGGVAIQGAAPDGSTPTALECGSVTDVDCAPGLSDGTGPGLIINANLFQGNTAESGSGGGLRLQIVNGTDVQRFPSNPAAWYGVQVTNNIFANNVAGWVGGGVSLQDALKVNFVNNTVVSNDTTATAGVLFDSLGAPNASVPPQGCNPTNNPTCAGNQVTTSTPQPAGLATQLHTANLLASFASASVCPGGHPQCTRFSNPMLHNDLFWQNRAFNITAPAGGAVQLNPALNQTLTGACPGGARYWDIGVYTDTAPSNHGSGLTMSPDWSILTDAADYPNGHNFGSNPAVVSQFCNGSRVPPEIAPTLCSGTNGHANAPGCIQPGTVGVGTTVPGGVADSLVPPQPMFTLTPAATVDEGNNWINMFYGPLSLSNPTIQTGGANYGVPLGNYALTATSPAIGAIPSSQGHPSTDFFGNQRPDAGDTTHFDIGAVEFGGTVVTPVLSSIAPNTGARGTVVPVILTGTGLTGTAAVTVSGTGVTAGAVTVVNSTTVTATFTITAGAGLTARNVTVTASGITSNAVTFTVVGPTVTSITPNTGANGTSVPVTITGTNLTGATTVTAGGGITVTTGITVNAAGTSLTATFPIGVAFLHTTRNVRVTTPGGITPVNPAVTFTVVGRPTLVSPLVPNNGGRGTVVAVTLTGTNLTGTTAVTVSGTGVTAGAVTVVNSTTVTANFTITATATLSARNVSVTTNGATSNTLAGAFTVHP